MPDEIDDDLKQTIFTMVDMYVVLRNWVRSNGFHGVWDSKLYELQVWTGRPLAGAGHYHFASLRYADGMIAVYEGVFNSFRQLDLYDPAFFDSLLRALQALQKEE